MAGHNLSGLIELVFVVGLIAWLWYSQVGRAAKDTSGRDAGSAAAGSQDEPPREG